MSEPKKGVAYEFYVSLVDAANPPNFKAGPTIEPGDFQVSTDGLALANLTTLPVVAPAGSVSVKVNLSVAEMNGDKVVVVGKDVAGAEWEDVLIFIDAPSANVDDIVKIEKILRNRTHTDRDTGIMTVFDNDGVTPLFTANIFEDVVGTKPYSATSTRVDRRDRLV